MSYQNLIRVSKKISLKTGDTIYRVTKVNNEFKINKLKIIKVYYYIAKYSSSMIIDVERRFVCKGGFEFASDDIAGNLLYNKYILNNWDYVVFFTKDKAIEFIKEYIKEQIEKYTEQINNAKRELDIWLRKEKLYNMV